MAIALIEDDEAILRSLSMLLESRGMAVRAYASAESFLADAAIRTAAMRRIGHSHARHVGPGAAARTQRRATAAVPVILITGHGDIAMAVQAIKQGAFDFIEKPFDDERLVASISQAMESGQRARVEQTERAELEARVAELSPRQVEVMHLVAEGFSNKEIAHRLNISPRTVENYRAWVMEKMGASNLAELVRKVIALTARRP